MSPQWLKSASMAAARAEVRDEIAERARAGQFRAGHSRCGKARRDRAKSFAGSTATTQSPENDRSSLRSSTNRSTVPSLDGRVFFLLAFSLLLPRQKFSIFFKILEKIISLKSGDRSLSCFDCSMNWVFETMARNCRSNQQPT